MLAWSSSSKPLDYNLFSFTSSSASSSIIEPLKCRGKVTLNMKMTVLQLSQGGHSPWTLTVGMCFALSVNNFLMLCALNASTHCLMCIPASNKDLKTSHIPFSPVFSSQCCKPLSLVGPVQDQQSTIFHTYKYSTDNHGHYPISHISLANNNRYTGIL